MKKSAGVHDDTTLLVGLDGVVVERVELDPDGCRLEADPPISAIPPPRHRRRPRAEHLKKSGH
jgi:hypothetical protein